MIPYVADQLAMARLPRATFALMLALLPAIATLTGTVILGQIPTVRDPAGIALVIAGIAVHRPDAPAREAAPRRSPRTKLKRRRWTTHGWARRADGVADGLGMMSHGDPATQSWALTQDQAEPVVRHAADTGIIFFDTAGSYSGGASEESTGRLLRKLFRHRDGPLQTDPLQTDT